MLHKQIGWTGSRIRNRCIQYQQEIDYFIDCQKKFIKDLIKEKTMKKIVLLIATAVLIAGCS